ncbi:uncharacterized protein F5Z01DRAFT_483222 [Emericellopsis atlantica]|uniref:Adhesin domain-containing protein n=1 Tax=Emericellopsis atlantica TaxID=2614577 RepID=A0A9P8CS06_9HYPO|nr:uncharacterized protein F5Z01DRAFT_483222 [Emericellopsis atlantica]KAG9256695.1 hypothetical protein F5Z01DRAFT_483222 [Emericellopsis atlantica]
MSVNEKQPVLSDNALYSARDEVEYQHEGRDRRPKGRAFYLVGGFVMTILLFVACGHWMSINGFQFGHLDLSDIVNQEMRPATTSYDDSVRLPNYCRNTPQRLPSTSQALTMSSGHNITIVQRVEMPDPHDKDMRPLGVSGAIIFRQTDGDHHADEVEIETIVNDESIQFNSDWDAAAQRLTLVMPHGVKGWRDNLGPCMDIRVTVWIAPGSTVAQLTADTVHLSIDILEDLDLQVDDRTTLKTVVRNVNAPEKKGSRQTPYSLASREIEIETSSGQVKGWYPLYDLLKIHTASGDITTCVGQNDAWGSDPKPAVLNVSSISGTVVVKEELDTDVPDRDYVVSMRSGSGSLSGDVAISSRASFGSVSGSLDLTLLPVLERTTAMAELAPKLATLTRSGSVKVNLLEPLWTDGARRSAEAVGVTPLSHLQSEHKSISGDIDLYYPASWTGDFRAQTMTGSQRFRGDGLHTRKQGGIPKVVVGHKGEGASQLTVETVTGREDFLVGREDWEL